MPDENDSPCELLVIGGLLVDDIAIAAENVTPKSSNPVKWQRRLGGVATNVARVAAQQLKVRLIANIGDDTDGLKLSRLLDQQHIPCALLEWQNEPSDRYTAVLNPDGELFVGLADAHLIEKMRWEHIQARLPTQAPQAVVLDANLTETCLVQTLAGLEEHFEKTTVYALTVSPVKSVRWQGLAARVDVLFCNRREAAALTQLDHQTHLDTLADALANCGFDSFVITDADKPILLQANHTRTHITLPRIAIEQNVNGAGDALAGATISQLLLGQSLVEAVQVAGLEAANRVLTGHVKAPSL